ncbi:MAG: GEVED domain-containing protein, partial [Flavobacteriales bacterium]
ATASLSQVSLVSDNFGTATQNPIARTGWTANSASGSNWELRTAGASTTYTWTNPAASFSGGANVFTNLGTNTNVKQLTYDNNISTAGYSNVVVRFGGLRTGTVPALNVLFSTDGTTYTSAGTVTLNTTWTAHSVNLPAGANGASNLRIRFEVTANSGSGNFLRLDDFQIIATLATPTQNGTIGANEYGTHTNGANQNNNGSLNTFVSWDATNLYVAVEGANLAQAHVFYIDRNPVIPVNGGVNSDGTNVGFNYDGASFAELPFRADAVMFVKNDYREFRTANGANGWSSQTSAFGAYGENAGTSTREYSISWANLGGFPVGGFNFFCFNVQTGPNVYNTQPTENPGGNIGTGARYSRYFTVTDATVGSGTPPFSRNSYVFTGTGNINNFGAISVWDFTMNTSSLQIARSNAGGNWTIGGTLRVNNGTVFFGSGGSGYGTTNVANVAITGSGSLNMDQTNQALNISGNLVQTGGTFFLSGTVGGDVVIQGNWTRDGGTFTNNARAVTFNSTGAQAIGGTATTDFGFLTINKATGALTLNRSANVNNLLTLTSGIVNTSATNILTITNTGAGSVSGGSGTSHINGPLVRNLPANLVSGSTYIFPVGKGGNYYPYTLTNPTSGASAPAITVEAFNTNAGGTAGVGISALSTTEHWRASFTGNYTGGSVSLARPTALGTLNVIGRSATVNGTYAKLNGTVSGTSVINSDNTGASLGFFTFGVNVPAPTITSLGSTSGCPGDQLVINGTNLTGAIAANTTIGGTPVASIVSNTGTVLTVVVGAGTTGSVAVTIAGQTGTSGTSYTVNPTPANPGNPTSDSPQCATPGVTLTRTGTPPGGETWYWQTSATGTSTANSGATFNVTTSGTYYIRAQGAGGCWSLGAGSVTVVVNNAPAAATTPTPANNATNVCYAGGGVVNSVSWTAVAGATSYDVYFGAGSLPGSVTSNVATNTYSTGTLSASTTYFWQVVAKNACGDAVGSVTWQFTTAASACGLTYCTPTYSSAGTNDLITQVTLGTLSQATASNPNPHYINYTTTQNAIPNLSQQGTFNLSLTFGSDPDQFSGVWVDFDQSATFDASEFFAGANPGANGTVIIPITVPAGATLGLTTMRIRGGEDDAVINSEACGASSSTFGQAQDYLVNIIVTQPTLFATPSGLSFGNIQNGSTSTEQTFGLSAIALSPAAGNLTVTAPTGYQVSLTSGSGFAGSVSVPYSGGALSSTTIYVIFSPNAADQLFSGNIVCSGGGAANNVNVAVTGNSYTTASFLFDNFNRADNNTVGIPSSGGSTAWTETEIGGDPFRARIESNTLQLHACSGVSGTTGGTGAEYVSFDASSIYPTTYSSANTTLTWEFNMRSNNNSPSGFDSNTYGTAFILGSDEANFRSTTADGYAVVIGNSGATDPVRLVRFANGMLLNSNITTIIASSSTTADAYYSVRVSLNTCTNTWSLQVRNDLGAFANPNTGTYNAPSTQVDNAHTSKNLRYFGAYWQHSSACSNISNFDNFYVPTGARPVVGPITGTASACAGTTGLTYSIPAVTGATTYAWTVPTGWNITAGGTTNSITVTAGAAGENGNISVTASNTCGSLGTSSPFAVTALPNNPVS